MEFLTWWFEAHYIAALVLTPMWSFAWAIYQDYGFGWTLICFTLAILDTIT